MSGGGGGRGRRADLKRYLFAVAVHSLSVDELYVANIASNESHFVDGDDNY